MRLSVVHTTEYTYDTPIDYGLQRLRLRPPTRRGQRVINWQVSVDGAVEEVSYKDHHGNVTDLVSIVPGSQNIRIQCAGEVETEDLTGIVGTHTQYTPLWLYQRDTPLTQRSPAITRLARKADEDDQIARMHQLMDLIAAEVTYDGGATDATTTASEALAAGRGVCQDHSHIFISAARALGLPARYVSGFLMMHGQENQSASHAWAEVFINSLGWVGFDVSNRMSPDAHYVCLATGLDYRDAAPVSGIRHGLASESLAVEVIVEQ